MTPTGMGLLCNGTDSKSSWGSGYCVDWRCSRCIRETTSRGGITMKLRLQTWTIVRRPATQSQPAFAFVVLNGVQRGLVRRTLKSETYQVPFDPDPFKNDDESFVKRAIAMSQNSWSIPRDMNFNWHLPMAKARGLPLSRVSFTTSLDGSFTCAIAATSQSFLPP